ncbi:MAG TPA: phosphatase PAP2 family protein [Candidatus Atopostipes pullistercoris]|uniref:Phosphatase PAP2 family protein n=1 Tax=Candidatus Atopostipes pullistercoris TaxID=2838467 RepID=A0A9D2JYN2_9LACT|nr:phosphatase PAP2 family protein [Candidatus Atopostipes pullistercoris]
MNKKIITHLNLLITTLIYITYPLVLFYLIYTRDERFWRVLLAPAISFVFVSMIRHYIDAPRPYEVKEIDPIIKKETKGNSFPSRHVFSAFVIATTLYFISKPLGILLMIAGFLLAVLRVIGGVHFPRDVIVGAIIGIVSGVLGFYI